MLIYLGETEVASRIHNAWLTTIEEGIHTYDIYEEGKSQEKVGTREFAQAVIKNLGEKPKQLKPVSYAANSKVVTLHNPRESTEKRTLVGVDVFVYAKESASAFERKIKSVTPPALSLTMISNRGVRVWPEGQPETFCIEQWRCRYMRPKKAPVSQEEIFQLLHQLGQAGYDIIKTEHLYLFEGAAGFSSAEG